MEQKFIAMLGKKRVKASKYWSKKMCNTEFGDKLFIIVILILYALILYFINIMTVNYQKKIIFYIGIWLLLHIFLCIAFIDFLFAKLY